MKIYGGHFYEDLLEIIEDGGEGTHQAARRVPGAPGTLLDAWWPSLVPPLAYMTPLG